MKAPSGRELSAKLTEGARVTRVLALLSVETIHRTARALLPPRKLGTFLPEEGLDLVPLKRVYVAVA